MTIVGDAFEDLFRATAASLGLPSLRAAITPYPVAPDGNRSDRLRARVADLIASVVGSLADVSSARA